MGGPAAKIWPGAELLSTLPHIQLRGLMTIAPLTDDESIIRHTFERTRELFDEIVAARFCGPTFKELSLGMSQDFELGIEFGATYVRIGTALYEGVELAPQVSTGRDQGSEGSRDRG